jgi:hypothetical protein
MPLPNPQQWLNWLARNRWVMLGVLAAFLAVLMAVGSHLGGDLPALASLNPSVRPRNEGALLEKSEALASGQEYTQLVASTNLYSPFFTEYFKPPPPPPPPPPVVVTNPPVPPPPPPPPPTKKVLLVYQGFMESSAGQRLAFIRVGDAQQVLTNGSVILNQQVLTNYTLATATLVGTNQTNVLNFNQPKEIEIPAP